MTRLAIIFAVLALSACGPIEVHPGSGRAFTIEHGTDRFGDAMEGARMHCSRAFGMDARHLGTDRPGGLALSRFECSR